MDGNKYSLEANVKIKFHQDEDARNKLQRLITGTGGAMALAPYDAIAEFHTKDYETWEKFILSVFSDPAIVGDQNKFVDGTSPLHIMGGYDNLIFGSGIRTSGGYNGIMPGDRRFRYAV